MSRSLRIGFVVLMLLLTVLFAGLGAWQVERLGEKEQLIAAVTDGMNQPPIDLPPAADLQPAEMRVSTAPDAASLVYRPLRLTGSWLAADTVLVFTTLVDPKGQAGGPGYWVMTPLALQSGGTVYINRGFIPQARAADFRDGGSLPEGEVTLTGIGLPAEAVSAFTPAANLADRIDWVRDPQRLSAFATAELPQPVLPIYLDLPAGAPGGLPQGGETVVEFPNNHLGYAMTWFGFAILTPIMLVFWLRRNRRRTV